MSRKSPMPMSRPSGILPAGKVFQVPPPAVDAKAVPADSVGTGCAGRTGFSATLCAGEARATAGAMGTVGAAVATGGFGGADGVAATIGGGVAVLDFCAVAGRTGADAATGDGDA